MIDITLDYIELKKIIKRLNDNDPTLSHLRYLAQYSLDGAGDWQKMLIDAIEANDYITHVDLSRNIEFSDVGALRIGSLLLKDHKITRLELRSCGIGSKGIKVISSALKTNNTLRTLDLSGNNVGDSILFIIDCIRVNRSLKSLKLRSCNILYDSTKNIAQGLRGNHTLQLLDLSQNPIGRMGLKTLFKYLNYEKSGIIYLGLEYIDFKPDDDVGIEEFCRFIEKSKNITHISLRGNVICSKDTLSITESLKKGRTLKKLNLGKTSMDEEKCKILGEYIGSPNCQIFSLSLSCNNLSQFGLCHILDGLKNNMSLTTLDLSNNGLTEFDGLELLSTLRGIQRRRIKQGNEEYENMHISIPITKLNVNNNKKLGSKFINKLSKLLRNGDLALEELSIANLGFNYKSGGTLIEAIKEATNLNTIDLVGNDISNEHVKQLAFHFKSSTSLALVYSDFNDKKKRFCKKDFKGLNLDKIPRTTFFISNLTELNLRNNNLTRIPPQISFLLLLKKLDVSENKLKTLPPELGRCVNIRKLKLLPGNDFKSPPQEIIECASDKPSKVLEYLRLFLDFDSIPRDWEEISIVKNIGKGSFGQVYEAYWEHQRVAVKQISVEGKDEETIYYEFRKEVSIMSELKNPFLVNLLGFCIEPTFTIIMDFAEYGDLYSYIHSDKFISWEAILKIANDIAQGLNYLHSKEPPFIHRDLKSPNVFLSSLDPDSEVMVKVGDFGLSSKMFSPSLKEKTKQRAVVNPTWLAPEILKEEEITLKSDIYSFGLILWELITRSHPFEEFKIRFLHELEDSIVKSNLRPKIPEDCPILFKELIEDCWHNDPPKRPLASEIIERLNKMKKGDKSPDLNSSSSEGSVKRRNRREKKPRRKITQEFKQTKSKD